MSSSLKCSGYVRHVLLLDNFPAQICPSGYDATRQHRNKEHFIVGDGAPGKTRSSRVWITAPTVSSGTTQNRYQQATRSVTNTAPLLMRLPLFLLPGELVGLYNYHNCHTLCAVGYIHHIEDIQ